MPPPIPARRRLLLAAAAGATWLALPALQALANGVADHGQRLWLDAAGDPLSQAGAALDLLPMRPVTASIRRTTMPQAWLACCSSHGTRSNRPMPPTWR